MWQRVWIKHCVCVQGLVIIYPAWKYSLISFRYQEWRQSNWGIRRSNSTGSFVRLNQCLPGVSVFLWARVRSCSYSFWCVLQFNAAIHVFRKFFSVWARFKNGSVSLWNFGSHLVELVLCHELFQMHSDSHDNINPLNMFRTCFTFAMCQGSFQIF